MNRLRFFSKLGPLSGHDKQVNRLKVLTMLGPLSGHDQVNRLKV